MGGTRARQQQQKVERLCAAAGVLKGIPLQLYKPLTRASTYTFHNVDRLHRASTCLVPASMQQDAASV